MSRPLFKQFLQADVKNIFLNSEEFADKHTIDGVEMNIIIDSNELIERQIKLNQRMSGMYSSALLIYVPIDQFGNKPKIGSQLNLDKKLYTVSECTVESGVYAITLEVNRA